MQRNSMMKRVSSKNKKWKGIEKFNTLQKTICVIILLIFIILLFLNLYKISILEARDFKTNEYLKSWRIEEGASFTVAYTHSVQLCPVTETYVIKDGEIILTETYFESFGAGLPASTPYTFEMKNKGFRIYDINEVMNNLVYRTGAERANHELIYKDKSYKFLDFSKPRTGVEFKVNRVPLLAYILREGL